MLTCPDCMQPISRYTVTYNVEVELARHYHILQDGKQSMVNEELGTVWYEHNTESPEFYQISHDNNPACETDLTDWGFWFDTDTGTLKSSTTTPEND